MDPTTGTVKMAAQIIQGKFPERMYTGKISEEMLAELTERVLKETDVRDVVRSFWGYCIERNLRPGRRAHFDWAHEMLGTMFVQDARIKR